MPNKLWSKLKDGGSRAAARDWAEALSIPDLTSSEWAKIEDLGPSYSDAEIRSIILADRSKHCR
ncbi:MAG: hypothetical protein WAZ34_09580 [Rhodocyclaceae bacterium]